jgi:hypothetical protein
MKPKLPNSDLVNGNSLADKLTGTAASTAQDKLAQAAQLPKLPAANNLIRGPFTEVPGTLACGVVWKEPSTPASDAADRRQAL